MGFFRGIRPPTISAVLVSFTLVTFASITLGSVPGAAAAVRAGHRGGILTVATGTNPPNLNHDLTTNLTNAMVQRLIENQLFEENAKQEVVPSLATGFHASKNGLTYTISLRHGVKWSDGVPFTSKDVVFTLSKFPPVSASGTRTIGTVLKSVKAVGTYEVVAQLKDPDINFVTLLAGTVFMMPEHLYGNQTVATDNTANDHPIGTGPYILKQWVPEQKIVLVRNPHFWGATKKDPLPWFNGVVVDIITSPQTIVDDLLNGTIDYVPTSFLPFTAIKELQQSACCRAVRIHGTPSFNIMWTNIAQAPFNNLTVRRAVYMAITRKVLIADALGGFGTLPLAPVTSAYAQLYTPKINLMKQYPYDPAKAAKMLDKAGYPVKNGERFGKAITLLYSTATGTFSTETAQIVKSELAKLTIKVSLVSEDITSWATQTFVKHNFTLSFIGLTTANNPGRSLQGNFGCQQPTPTTEFSDPSGYCTKEVTSLLHEGQTALTVADAQRDYAKAQKIVDKALPAYELAWRVTYVAVSKRVQNWQASLLTWGGSFQTTWTESWFK